MIYILHSSIWLEFFCLANKNNTHWSWLHCSAFILILSLNTTKNRPQPRFTVERSEDHAHMAESEPNLQKEPDTCVECGWVEAQSVPFSFYIFACSGWFSQKCNVIAQSDGVIVLGHGGSWSGAKLPLCSRSVKINKASQSGVIWKKTLSLYLHTYTAYV